MGFRFPLFFLLLAHRGRHLGVQEFSVAAVVRGLLNPCCSGLKTVLKTDPRCLCETFRNSAQLGITLNMTKAIALSAACYVSAPAAPAYSPLDVSPSSVAGAPTATSAGANFGAPTPTPGSSTSSAPAVSIELLVFTSVVVVVANALF